MDNWRNIAVQLASIKLQRGIFYGVDAAIICFQVYNPDRHAYDVYSEWVGGDIAAVSLQMMNSLNESATVGSVVSLDQVSFELIEFSDIGDFWYVRRLQ